MTPAELDRNIGILSHEDMHYLQKNWEAAARAIFEQAAAGADIAAAIPPLITVYLEATQIGVLRAAAAAVAVHDLRSEDVRNLRTLLEKSQYRDWIFDGVGDAIAKGSRLAPAVDLLLEFCAYRSYSVVHLLLRDAGKRGFAEAARRVALGAPRTLAEFLKEAQSKKIPIESALPALAAQLTDGKLALNAATALRWLVELGADLSSVVTPLEGHLNSNNEEIAVEAGYCLAYHHAAQLDWPPVDALLEHKLPRVRWAAARALRVRLMSGSKVAQEVVDRVAAGLLSADPDTAARSLVSLRESKARKFRCAPSPAMASRLAAAIDDGIAEYLHFALPASRIRTLLPAGDSPAAKRLAAAKDACRICERLPRSGSWDHDSDLPPGYTKLVGTGGLCHCPECGRPYGRYYEDEWDDMSHSQTWSLVRFTPPEAISELKGVAQQAYRAALDTWLVRFRTELGHPARAVREEAAFDLGAQFAASGNWGEVAALIASSEDAVIARVLESVRRRPEDFAAILGPLRGLLDSPSPTVRSHTADLLATRSVARNELAPLRELLDSPSPEILAAAVQAIGHGTLHGFDAAPLLDRVAVLRLRPESGVSAAARRVIRVLAAKPESPDALPFLVEDLSSPDEDLRTSAIFAIGQIAPSRPDAARSIPALIALLRDTSCTSWSMTALQALADAGGDILEAIPVIVECALESGASRRPDLIYWLQRLHAKGAKLGPHVAGLAGLLAGDESTQTAVHQLLQEIFRQGGDISAAVAPLRSMLENAPPYIREYGARLLAEWHLGNGDLEGLKILLRHRNPEPPGVCADTLRQKRVDVTPFLPDLVRLTDHPRSWVRDQSAGALLAFARSGSGPRDATLAALEGAGEIGKTVRGKILQLP